MGQSQGKAKGNEELLLTSSTTTTTSKEGNYILSTASKLSKSLPTGVLFVLQALSNLITNNGECGKSNHILVGVVLGILGILCFVISLTDTFKDASTGKVHCGIATINGIATGNKVKPANKSEYRLKMKDLVHAAVALVVFSVMALTNQNIVLCLYPSAQSSINKVLQAVPIVVIGVSSVIVVLVPSKRNGITSLVTTGAST
ncbi:hypothetical protein SUGI_0887800 [Cryptomeria japonica]|nr:hypothetical protein SUGI_0887800 [Cryptomeria japonica]